MKIYSMFHVLTLLIVCLTFSMPLLTLAQENAVEPALSEQAQAIQDAERDANANVNRPMWFMFGCLFSGIGLLAPYFYQQPPPAAALLGKSSTYVAYYTDTYKRKTQNLQFAAAGTGCVLGALTTGCFFVISVAFQAR